MSSFELGNLIYACKPYVYVLNNDVRGRRCDYCFMKQDGLKRCSQCAFMYFCDKNCQVKAWGIHQAECKFIKQAKPNTPAAALRLLAYILFKIKKYGLDEPYDIIHGHKMNFQRLMSHASEIKQSVKTCQQMMALLGTLKSFIGENNIPPPSEFIEIFGKMCVNTFSICDSEMQSIGSGIYLGASIFDHSCEPDAEVVFDGTELRIHAVKNIPHKDVTKIYISYIDQLQLLEERQNYLTEQYYFSCQCIRCTSSYHEDLMTKIFVNENEVKTQLIKFKEEIEHIKQMKKSKAGASKIYEACIRELEKQENVLADTHISRIKIFELAFDACIQNSQWTDAVIIGKQLIEPYRLLYGVYHPAVGIHFFKVGKIQNFIGLTESALKNLLQAEEILKITHGADHPLYKDLVHILNECQTYAAIEK